MKFQGMSFSKVSLPFDHSPKFQTSRVVRFLYAASVDRVGNGFLTADEPF